MHIHGHRHKQQKKSNFNSNFTSPVQRQRIPPDYVITSYSIPHTGHIHFVADMYSCVSLRATTTAGLHQVRPVIDPGPIQIDAVPTEYEAEEDGSIA